MRVRGLGPWLVGWLWADLLLGMFVIFLAASAAGIPADTKAAPLHRVDPQPLTLTISLNGADLLTSDAAKAQGERDRVAAQLRAALVSLNESRQVAIVLAFASHDDPATGDRLAREATNGLHADQFAEAAVNAYHELRPGDTGTKLSVELYFFD